MLSKFGKFNGNKTIVNCANFSLTGCFLKLDSYESGESGVNLVILVNQLILVNLVLLPLPFQKYTINLYLYICVVVYLCICMYLNATKWMS